MSSSNLIRWVGLAALTGGALLVISEVLNAVLFPDEPSSNTMLTGVWFIVQVLGLVSLVFITLGLVGMYLHQAQRAETLGLIAFVIAFSGLMMVFGLFWGEPFLGPLVAKEAPGLLGAEPSGALAVGSIISIVLFTLGWFLFGLASLRARVLPRGASILMIIGALLSFALTSLNLPLWSVVLGAAIAWIGYGLLFGIGDRAGLSDAAAR